MMTKLDHGDKIIVRCPKSVKCNYLTGGKEYVGTVSSVWEDGQVFFSFISDTRTEDFTRLKGAPHLNGLNWQYVRRVKS